ncbi:MAG: hypothetical protein QOH49_150 [Acidobacteriota bacterium]|jgi:hypothetical protein|nr:hypothetical protein [Acidobacteriota bacterium]
MEERLKGIFANVNEWLKFAEAKNAAIIAADAAASFGALTLVLSKDNLPAFWLYIYLHSFTFFVALSAIVALLSVIPKTKVLLNKPKEERQANDNLLFYGHIAKYTPEEYLTELRKRYEEHEPKNSGLEFDYAQQITINSQITLRKYDFFRYASWLALTGILTPLLIIPLLLLVRTKNSVRPKSHKLIPSHPKSIESPQSPTADKSTHKKENLTSQPPS